MIFIIGCRCQEWWKFPGKAVITIQLGVLVWVKTCATGIGIADFRKLKN
jgi:hypothetical protein